MNTQQLARADYLDIVFDGRNKTYGAFELRKHYAQRTRRALGVVLGISCLLAAYPLFAGTTTGTIRRNPPPVKMTELKIVPPTPKKIEVRPAVQQPHVQAAPPPRIVYVEPKIVPDHEVIKPPVTIDSLRDKVIASTAGDGEKGGTALSPSLGDDPVGPAVIDPPATGRDHNAIVGTVDQKPEFNGNLGTWLSTHLEYPESALATDAQGSVMMQFVVNEDGSISDISVLKGAGHGFEAEAARVIKMMPRWKPAKLNGEAVRTWFRLPVVFALAGD